MRPGEWLRRRGLRLAFVVALGWSFILPLLYQELWALFAGVPALVVWALPFAAAFALVVVICRLRPGFMQLPGSVTPVAFLVRLALSFPAAAVVLSTVAALYAYYFLYLPDIDNLQAGLNIFFAVFVATFLWAPAAALVLAWWLSDRAAGRRLP
jgi:hypothetical protein